MPRKEFLKTIEEEIKADNLILIKDPFARVIEEKDLSMTHINKRNEDWDFIVKCWFANKAVILDKNLRNKSLSDIANSSGLSISKVKKVLSRYWQRGLNKNALIPDYINSGGKGKEKNCQLVK